MPSSILCTSYTPITGKPKDSGNILWMDKYYIVSAMPRGTVAGATTNHSIPEALR